MYTYLFFNMVKILEFIDRKWISDHMNKDYKVRHPNSNGFYYESTLDVPAFCFNLMIIIRDLLFNQMWLVVIASSVPVKRKCNVLTTENKV